VTTVLPINSFAVEANVKNNVTQNIADSSIELNSQKNNGEVH
jgi:hypothetical protein